MFIYLQELLQRQEQSIESDERYKYESVRADERSIESGADDDDSNQVNIELLDLQNHAIESEKIVNSHRRPRPTFYNDYKPYPSSSQQYYPPQFPPSPYPPPYQTQQPDFYPPSQPPLPPQSPYYPVAPPRPIRPSNNGPHSEFDDDIDGVGSTNNGGVAQSDEAAFGSEIHDLTSDIRVNQVLYESGRPFNPDAEFISVPNQPRPRPFENYPPFYPPFFYTAFRDIKK